MTIKLKGWYDSRAIFLNDSRLIPDRSLRLRNHSPDGFNWAYSGSGPSQLALAILLECISEDKALKNYHKFKDEVIAGLPQSDFEIEIDIKEYL